MSAIDKLPARHWAHPFDRQVRMQGDQETHGVDFSPSAIGGAYGIGWYEAFQCHRTGELYAVHCSDGVRRGKAAHSDDDLAWMQAMRRHIIARTQSQPKGPIVLSSNEWTLMIHSSFVGWLDALPRESEDDPIRTVGDQNRYLLKGQIGTINNVPVIVDPTTKDTLPPVGNVDGEETILSGRTRVAAPRHEPTRFEGVFAAALAKAGVRAS